MYVERKYSRLDWFDFLDIVNQHLIHEAPNIKELYDITYELEARKLECISEGGIFKYHKAAQSLVNYLEEKEVSEEDLVVILESL
jgi:hypothetical protein